MTRYLEQEEKAGSRELWRSTFPEDSEAFLDYYEQEIMKNNKIMVIEDGKEIISMAHLNPYRVSVRGRLINANYIVAVATLASRRHQGLMRKILTQMLNDMHDDRMAFTYLMPADENIYLPFDFAFIFDSPKWQIKEEVKNQILSKALGEDHYYFQETADFMNTWLAARAEVFCLRDADYVKRLQKELQSENGQLEMLYDASDERRLVGIRAYWGVKEKELRILLPCAEYGKGTGEKKPAIMARITHLAEFVRSVRLVKDAPMEELTIELNITDSLIPGNNGSFLWKLDKKTSLMQARTGEADTAEELLSAAEISAPRQQLSLTIQELTGWLFGYDFPENHEENGLIYEVIDTLHGVYIDEIV